MRRILPAAMRRLTVAVLLAGLLPVTASVRAETEQIDLKALATTRTVVPYLPE